LRANTDEAMESLKKGHEQRSATSRCAEFKKAFASEIAAASQSADEGRIASCKAFLGSHTTHLHDLTASLKETVDAQRAATRAIAGVQLRLQKVCEQESEALTGAGVTEQPRTELAAALRRQSRALEPCPALHYDMLLAASERELLEAEAMQEAVDSLETLQKDLFDAKTKAGALDETLTKVRAGGEIPSTGTGVARMLGIAPQKDREERIQQMEAEHAQKKEEVSALRDFYAATRSVLVAREIDKFLQTKVAEQKKTKQSFAGLSKKTAEALTTSWGASGHSSSPLSALVGGTSQEWD